MTLAERQQVPVECRNQTVGRALQNWGEILQQLPIGGFEVQVRQPPIDFRFIGHPPKIALCRGVSTRGVRRTGPLAATKWGHGPQKVGCPTL